MKKVSVSKTSKDSKGRILNVELTIEEVPLILVNYTILKQSKTLCELDLLLNDFLLDDSKNIMFAGDLNWWFSYSEKKVYFKDLTTYSEI